MTMKELIDEVEFFAMPLKNAGLRALIEGGAQ